MSHQGRQNADDLLALALACGATVEAAAAKAGVSARTAHRRLADTAFTQRVRDMRCEMVQRAMGALTAAAMEAVKTLLDLQGTSVANNVRLGAARAILELGARLRESAELELRIADLEQRLADFVNNMPKEWERQHADHRPRYLMA